MATPAAVLAVVRSARPAYRKPADRLAFALHAVALTEGYRLLAVGAAAGTAAEPPSAAADAEADPLAGWNSSPDSYAFQYAAEEGGGAAGLLVKIALLQGAVLAVSALGGRAGAAAGVRQGAFDVAEFVDAAGGLRDLAKLVPRAAGVLTGAKPAPAAPTASASAAAAPNTTGGAAGGVMSGVPCPPGGGAGGFSGPYIVPGVPGGPYGIGAGDLLPPGMGPGGGGDPSRLFEGGGGLVGPRHPGWGGGALGPGPGLGPLPPGHPAGARWDPYGPPGIPGFEPGRFGQGGPRRPRDVHPDIGPPPEGGDSYYG